MTARVADRDRYKLPDRFWLEKGSKWELEFRQQARKAAELLKDYSIQAIIAALRSTRGKKVYSLGAKSVLVPLIKAEQKVLDHKAILAAEQAAEQAAERAATSPLLTGPGPARPPAPPASPSRRPR
jgi:hypothetical protein